VSGHSDRSPATVTVVVLVGAGGAVGAASRYGVALVVGGLAGTLTANVLGSFALGLLVAGGDRLGVRLRLALGAGLLSSFTTYSTFALETVTATPPVAAGYVLASVVLGLAGAAAAATLVDRVDTDADADGDVDGDTAAGPDAGGERP